MMHGQKNIKLVRRLHVWQLTSNRP